MAGAEQPVRKVTIVGGGTAGWMTAAVLSKWLSKVEIRLIESDEIGTIGVGEATIPHIRNFIALAGIDPFKMISESKATFKLGIEFVDWGAPGETYIHGFGRIGKERRSGLPCPSTSWTLRAGTGVLKTVPAGSMPAGVCVC